MQTLQFDYLAGIYLSLILIVPFYTLQDSNNDYKIRIDVIVF